MALLMIDHACKTPGMRNGSQKSSIPQTQGFSRRKLFVIENIPSINSLGGKPVAGSKVWGYGLTTGKQKAP